MWLLDTSSLTLAAFFDDNTPPYAILSHTWGAEEVSFQDIQGPHEGIWNRAGYKKIKGCSAQALDAGFQYVWVDTCCIDKTNNTELSEAINSMFRWYENAVTCYAYLEDVHPETRAFSESRWFTRGWTLQELIAPTDLMFFDCFWNEIGSRASLGTIIKEITGIPIAVLTYSSLRDHCIAEIMSWAAGRKTTRIEDRAYSLLGLFGVSMPLIYGEGEKSFLRLQLEIMKTTTDHSLFAWFSPVGDNLVFSITKLPTSAVSAFHWYKGPGRGALASSVDEFEDSGGIRSFPVADDLPFEMTNLGLRITLPCVSGTSGKDDGRLLFAILNCKHENEAGRLGIWLKEVTTEEGKPMGRFIRSHLATMSEDQGLWNGKPTPTLLHIIQPNPPSFTNSESIDIRPLYCSLDYSALFEAGYLLEAAKAGAKVLPDDKHSITCEIGYWDPWIIIFKHTSRATRFWVALGGVNGRIWSMIGVADCDYNMPQSIMENMYFQFQEKRHNVLGVSDRILERLHTGEVLKLTTKRAIVSNRVGFIVNVAIFDEKQDFYLKPPRHDARI